TGRISAQSVKSLIVEDNGSGISDFQKLLTLAESGWDENVSQVEKPFGIGWFSTLFSAQSVTIESAGKSCHLVSKDVLDMKPVKLTSVQDTGFTRIHLLGVDFDLLPEFSTVIM
ncbi:hypothetical protein HV832_16525, partial [Undibacterium oligocarboniphilum]|nr:hypothetical protein [Undibacterium oligocarboniphilum]